MSKFIHFEATELRDYQKNGNLAQGHLEWAYRALAPRVGGTSLGAPCSSTIIVISQ